MPAKKPRRRTTLTRDDWLAEAMELLRERGVGGVRILTLAQRMKVSRGSFYWHFKDLADLLEGMLEWWDREMTDSVIRHTETVSGRDRKRLQALGEFILTSGMNRYDTAMRAWAQGDQKARAVVARVMQKRLGYVTSLFLEAGFSPSEATARGHLLAVYIMSEGTIHMDESLETRLRLLRRQVRSLTKPSS